MLLIFLFGIAGAEAADGPTKIRFLNWWNYIDPKVLKKLQANGFEVDSAVYKSNEAGLSRLVSKSSSFDIAVVSNEVLPLILSAGLVEAEAPGQNLLGFEEFAKPRGGFCLPYLWGSSVFAYDSRKVKEAPSSLRDLIALKKNRGSIAIDDDSFIVAARILGDGIAGCPTEDTVNNFFARINSCPQAGSELKSFPLSKEDFRTNLDGFYAEENALASYGWHGVIAASLGTYPWIQFKPAKKNPIIGVDYACILKQPGKPTASLKRRIEFLKKLTDPESTRWNVAYSQYFSPRISDTEGLKPKVKELRDEIMLSIKTSQAVVITPPDSVAHKVINSWWQALRYGR